MAVELDQDPISNKNELAFASLLTRGRLYAKRPALSGFRVYYSNDPRYSTYNPLEDAVYSGAGIYMIGLLGEAWKIGSFERLTASYVVDTTVEEREITETLLLGTEPPNEADLSSCLAVRYRAGTTPSILAARVPLSVKSIEHISEDGTRYTLHANRALNSRGEAIDHGEGDLIACSLVPAEDAELDEEGSYQFGGTAYRPKLSGSYIINGVVFAKTYVEAAC